MMTEGAKILTEILETLSNFALVRNNSPRKGNTTWHIIKKVGVENDSKRK